MQSFRMFLPLVCVLGILSGSGATDILSSSVSDALLEGVAVASRLLRLGNPEILSSVFRKITLGKVQAGTEGQEEGGSTKELLPVALALGGADSAKVKNLALNGFISLLHLTSEVLAKKGGTERNRRAAESFSPLRFVLDSPPVARLLDRMRDPALVESLLEEIAEAPKERPPEDEDCVRLLLCKTKPFVRGMQRSLDFFARREGAEPSEGGRRRTASRPEDASWEEADLEDRMYYFLPRLEEFIGNGDECDERFPSCGY